MSPIPKESNSSCPNKSVGSGMTPKYRMMSMKKPDRRMSMSVPRPGGKPRRHPRIRNVSCTACVTCPMESGVCIATPTLNTPPGYIPRPEFRFATKPK